MTVSDLDIYRAAHVLVEQHGADAEVVALERYAVMTMRGDNEGVEVWTRIRRAIAELQGMPTGPAH